MAFICGGTTTHDATDNGGPLNCPQINENWVALDAMHRLYCAGATMVYFLDHASATLTIPAANLPIGSPNRIKVRYNGNTLEDEALSGFGAGSGYLVTNVSTITLGFTPPGTANYSNVVVEYWPDPV
jgi:hypothetical protein